MKLTDFSHVTCDLTWSAGPVTSRRSGMSDPAVDPPADHDHGELLVVDDSRFSATRWPPRCGFSASA